ncbi:MAG: hypothetical protein IJI58_04635 [Bacilli bacterium]|nr:hypothetical protein [Bacilli bacterium]
MISNKVDGYIEPIVCNGDIYNYKMYMLYNGIEPCYLNNFPETASFASYFKRKMSCRNDEMLFANTYGLKAKYDDQDSMLSTITGLDNIDKSLVSLICACTNLDIQADLTIHIKDKDYPLVRTVDDKKYVSYNLTDLSDKGLSDDVLLDLSLDIENLKRTKILSQKRRY